MRNVVLICENKLPWITFGDLSKCSETLTWLHYLWCLYLSIYKSCWLFWKIYLSIKPRACFPDVFSLKFRCEENIKGFAIHLLSIRLLQMFSCVCVTFCSNHFVIIWIWKELNFSEVWLIRKSFTWSLTKWIYTIIDWFSMHCYLPFLSYDIFMYEKSVHNDWTRYEMILWGQLLFMYFLHLLPNSACNR